MQSPGWEVGALLCPPPAGLPTHGTSFSEDTVERLRVLRWGPYWLAEWGTSLELALLHTLPETPSVGGRRAPWGPCYLSLSSRSSGKLPVESRCVPGSGASCGWLFSKC